MHSQYFRLINLQTTKGKGSERSWRFGLNSRPVLEKFHDYMALSVRFIETIFT